MSVLEILQLHIKPILTPTDPSILTSLIQVRTSLREKVHNTNSKFYQCIEDPSLIYVFGLWPSLQTHHSFLSSPERASVLAPQENTLEFNWVIHIPLSSMDGLPLHAPVLCIARLFLKNDEGLVTRYENTVEKYREKVKEMTAPYKVVHVWRVDLEEDKKEAVIITGWGDVEAHPEAMKRLAGEKGNEDYATVGECYSGVDVKHARNMES
jgi:hypothetical protein